MSEQSELCDELDAAFDEPPFRRLVFDMRRAQKFYLATKQPSDLERARVLADKVDAVLRWRPW